MTAATAHAPTTGASSRTHPIRLALVALVVAVVLAASFAIGRITVSSAHHVPAVQTTNVGRPAPQHCGVPGIPC